MDAHEAQLKPHTPFITLMDKLPLHDNHSTHTWKKSPHNIWTTTHNHLDLHSELETIEETFKLEITFALEITFGAAFKVGDNIQIGNNLACIHPQASLKMTEGSLARHPDHETQYIYTQSD